MNPLIDQLSTRIERVSTNTKQHFASLSSEQLNWKSHAKSWSIAECLQHLIITNELYFKQFDRVLKGGGNHSIWERLPFWANFIGNSLLKTLTPEAKRKVNAPRIFRPSQSEISTDIVNQFLIHNQQLLEYLKKLKAHDLTINISSPVASFLPLPLEAALNIIVNHEERHFTQAKQVLEQQKEGTT